MDGAGGGTAEPPARPGGVPSHGRSCGGSRDGETPDAPPVPSGAGRTSATPNDAGGLVQSSRRDRGDGARLGAVPHRHGADHPVSAAGRGTRARGYAAGAGRVIGPPLSTPI